MFSIALRAFLGGMVRGEFGAADCDLAGVEFRPIPYLLMQSRLFFADDPQLGAYMPDSFLSFAAVPQSQPFADLDYGIIELFLRFRVTAQLADTETSDLGRDEISQHLQGVFRLAGDEHAFPAREQ